MVPVRFFTSTGRLHQAPNVPYRMAHMPATEPRRRGE